MYKIITTPHPTLTQVASEVKQFDKKLLQIIEEMKQTLDATVDPEGVGLAAPQVDKSLQLFLAKPKKEGPTAIFINPHILERTEAKKSKKTSKKEMLEGCLSIPNIWGNVTRSSTVTLAYQDEKGEKHTETFNGFMATIIQHEVDHLNGILFTKHVLEQKNPLYKSHKDDNGEDVFEEIKI